MSKRNRRLSQAERRHREVKRLERTMKRIARELEHERRVMSETADAMRYDGLTHKQHTATSWDQWEMRYIQAHESDAIPASAYQAKTTAGHCAAPATCTLGCAGCRHA